MATADLGMNVRVYRDGVPVYHAHFEGKNSKGLAFARIRGLALAPDGATLYVAAGDSVHRVHWPSQKILWTYRAPKAFGFLIVPPIALTATESFLLATFENGKTLSWNDAGERARSWSDNDAPHFTAAMAQDRILGSDGHTLCVWDANTGEKLLRMPLPERVYSIAASNEAMAVARGLGAAYVVDLATATVTARLAAASGLPLVDVSPLGVIALGVDGAVLLFNAAGERLTILEDGGPRILAMKFHPQERVLVVGRVDETVDFLALP